MSYATKSALLLAAIVCLSFGGVRSDDKPKCPIHRLNEVNQYLVENAQSEDIGENIASLESYALESSSGLNPFQVLNLEDQQAIKADIIQANSFNQAPKCDLQESQVIDRLYQSLYQEADTTETAAGKCLHRISTVLNAIMKEYNQKCADKVESAALKADEDASAESRKVAGQLLDLYLASQQVKGMNRDTALNIVRTKTFYLSWEMKDIINLLDKFVDRETLDVLKRAERNVLAEILQNHLLKGCKEYIGHTGETARAASLQLIDNEEHNFQDATLRVITASHLCQVASNQLKIMKKL